MEYKCQRPGCGSYVTARSTTGLCKIHRQAKVRSEKAGRGECYASGCHQPAWATGRYCVRHKSAQADRDCMRRYGLTREQVEAKVVAQGGCAICGGTECRGKAWCQDHDHSFPLGNADGLRSVLCTPCNVGIGHMGDDPLTAAKAVVYLLEHHRRLHPEKEAA